MHLTDRRGREWIGIELHEQLVERFAELALQRRSSELEAHRRSVCAQFRERHAERFRQTFVEVARHLPELHQRALHVAEALSDLLRRLQLSLMIELDPSVSIGEQLARRRRRLSCANLDAELGELGVAACASLT